MRKGEEGSERERETGKEEGTGKGEIKRCRKEGRERWEDGEIEKGHRERKRWV